MDSGQSRLKCGRRLATVAAETGRRRVAAGRIGIDTERGPLMKPNLGLSDDTLKQIIEQLNPLLADEQMFYARLRNFHWNVTGANFRSLHLMFEEQYKEVAEVADELAERIRSLGGRAIGTLREFLDQSRLKEQPGDVPDWRAMCRQLVADHETIIQALRKAVEKADQLGDEGTADILTGFMESHTKMAWMLRATAAE